MTAAHCLAPTLARTKAVTGGRSAPPVQRGKTSSLRRGQSVTERIAIVSEGRTRNEMTAMARTVVVPEAAAVGALSALLRRSLAPLTDDRPRP